MGFVFGPSHLVQSEVCKHAFTGTKVQFGAQFHYLERWDGCKRQQALSNKIARESDLLGNKLRDRTLMKCPHDFCHFFIACLRFPEIICKG
jgi:hypothetical protein